MTPRHLAAAIARTWTTLALLLAGCAPSVLQSGPAAAADWCGTYVFDGAAGHTAGGSPILYHYSLTVGRATSASACALHLEGFQQDESLRCRADGASGTLGIAFASYAKGALTNAYGVQVYRPGELLLTLDHPRDAPSALRTTWHAVHPDGVAQSGPFFRRQSYCSDTR